MSLSDYEALKNIPVWRCISAQRKYGHWEYMFDDPVIETHLEDYIQEMSTRGAQRITLHLVGPLSIAMNGPAHKPMHGTESLTHERKNRTLDEFVPGAIQ